MNTHAIGTGVSTGLQRLHRFQVDHHHCLIALPAQQDGKRPGTHRSLDLLGGAADRDRHRYEWTHFVK